MNSDSYYEPPEDAWDVYAQKREEIVNEIWDMPLAKFDAEMAGFPLLSPDQLPLNRLGAAIDKAVDELAQRTLEEYVEGMADYQAEREYQARKEGERERHE